MQPPFQSFSIPNIYCLIIDTIIVWSIEEVKRDIPVPQNQKPCITWIIYPVIFALVLVLRLIFYVDREYDMNNHIFSEPHNTNCQSPTPIRLWPKDDLVFAQKGKKSLSLPSSYPYQNYSSLDEKKGNLKDKEKRKTEKSLPFK